MPKNEEEGVDLTKLYIGVSTVDLGLLVGVFVCTHRFSLRLYLRRNNCTSKKGSQDHLHCSFICRELFSSRPFPCSEHIIMIKFANCFALIRIRIK